ncbi:GNAT family N-acetyltransferase [Kitasatospora sp. NPDC052896]|uniref:GNAT family N-acetyltransferase n=1 Tax=Kitasatospora sp. NPDC052896 TaxID=3364061 RepID=UPI0037C8D1D9
MAEHAHPDFATKPVLSGERVLLRPFEPAGDLDALREMLRDPEVARMADGAPEEAPPPPWDEAAELRFRQWYDTRNGQTDRLDLAVVDRATGCCVGEVVLNAWQPDHHSCNIRIALGPAGRNRGLGTEAMRLMTGHAFEQLGLHRLSLDVFAFNPRARRAYENVGFVVEGVHRDALRDGDRWVDEILMSVLAPEWERHRGHPRLVR